MITLTAPHSRRALHPVTVILRRKYQFMSNATTLDKLIRLAEILSVRPSLSDFGCYKDRARITVDRLTFYKIKVQLVC
jgi:hypothetical protein